MNERGDSHKHDHGKMMWDLLPLKEVEKIVQVLHFGALKYGPNNWQRVPDAKNRYFAALMRHLASWQSGEQNDSESGRSHLAHAGCCLLFLLWFDGKPRRKRKIADKTPET